MEALKFLEGVVFNEGFWLPTNVTWKDFEVKDNDTVYIPRPRDLLMIFPVAALIHVARLFFERCIAYPLGKYMNIPTHKADVSANPALEAAFRQSQYVSEQEAKKLSKQLDITEKTLQRWFRRRRNQDRSSSMIKFTETAWRCFFYLSIFLYGLWVVGNKSWFWDVKDCWRGYPRQHMDREVYWYYMIELGFYVCLLFSQFADVQRKDFWEQFVHHIATIFLMTFSWTANIVRAGALILCLHDTVDYLLEGAKLARYMNYRTLCDALFVIFMIAWFCTRLTLFPYVILYTTSIDASNIAGYSHALAVVNVLLWVLQCLHIFWFFLIAKVAYRAVVAGKVEKDVRSDSEESEDEAAKPSHTPNQRGDGSNGFKAD